jgi:hypothetical protein
LSQIETGACSLVVDGYVVKFAASGELRFVRSVTFSVAVGAGVAVAPGVGVDGAVVAAVVFGPGGVVVATAC